MKRLLVLSLIFSLFFWTSNSCAQNESIYKYTVSKPMDKVYNSITSSFENSRFFIVDELNIGKNISGFANRWDNFNLNNLTGFKSIVFCNGWFANKVSNEDPEMLAFCPMHITLIEREGKTTALFVRPTFIAKRSPALKTFEVIESRVISIIETGMKN